MPGPNYLASVSTFGTYYDWPTGGITPTGTAQITAQTSRKMPINRNNTKVQGKYLPGGDWLAWEANDYHSLLEPATIVRPGFGRAYDGRGFVTWKDDAHWNAIKTGPSAAEILQLTNEANSWGAEGWRRARPAQPDFSAAQSLYELKDIPELLKSSLYQFIKRVTRKKTWLSFDWTRKRFFNNRNKSYVRRTSEWHLAIQFGWLPILKDVIGFLDTLENQDKILAQTFRDEGKPIKRRRTLGHPKDDDGYLFANQVNVVEHPYAYNPNAGPVLVTQCYAPSPQSSSTGFVTTGRFRREFVAQFRYWLPPGPRDHAYIKSLTRRLYGLRVTPSMVWAVMPWSWLVDYFVDVKSVIDFVSPGMEDCLICDYAYVVYNETRTKRCNTNQSVMISNDKKKTLLAYRLYERKIKFRIHATYFGFRVKDEDLSYRQQGILLALGGSKPW